MEKAPKERGKRGGLRVTFGDRDGWERRRESTERRRGTRTGPAMVAGKASEKIRSRWAADIAFPSFTIENRFDPICSSRDFAKRRGLPINIKETLKTINSLINENSEPKETLNYLIIHLRGATRLIT